MKVSIFIAIVLTVKMAAGQVNIPGDPKEVVNFQGTSVQVFDFEGFKPVLAMNDGKTYVINFWATWCKPCVEELPHFVKLSQELEGGDVIFLYASLDFRKNLEKSVLPFIKAHGLEGRTVLLSDPDANTWINKVDPSWSGAIPATLVYRGNKRSFTEGTIDYEELKRVINSF